MGSCMCQPYVLADLLSTCACNWDCLWDAPLSDQRSIGTDAVWKGYEGTVKFIARIPFEDSAIVRHGWYSPLYEVYSSKYRSRALRSEKHCFGSLQRSSVVVNSASCPLTA